MLTGRIVQPAGRRRRATPPGSWQRWSQRAGEPVIRAGAMQAMRIMGEQFVLGRTIDAALKRGARHDARRGCHALFLRHAGRGRAHQRRRRALSRRATPTRSTRSAKAPAARARSASDGISVKLSALHPRYEARQDERVIASSIRACCSSPKRRQEAQHRPHPRRRGGRPPGAVAEAARAPGA